MLGYRITFEGETLYVFDLLVPEIFHEGQRKKNAVDSQDNAASTKPVNSRKGFYLDDIVGTLVCLWKNTGKNLKSSKWMGMCQWGF